MTHIGIMQGRLTPPYEGRFQCFPKDHWRQEFPAAALAGLEAIEWIFDAFGLEVNPLISGQGRQEILALATLHGVAVRSTCADYFIDFPLVRASPGDLSLRVKVLADLIEACGQLGMERIVLPFVDASRIDTGKDLEDVVGVLRDALDRANTTGVEIHLETDLSPRRFAQLLDRLPHPRLKVNYDSGNSASLGFDVREEVAAYGTRVGSVHIKDRILGGGTIPLGQGRVNFPNLWECLKGVNYLGDFILQVARDVSGEETAWARRNRAFVVDALTKYRIGSHGPAA